MSARPGGPARAGRTLITDHVETQRLPSSPNHLNQQSGTAPSDHRRLRWCRCAEVQHLLIWWDQLGPTGGHQHSQPGLVMGRPEMLDDPVFAAFLDHDLHSCRPGSGLHLPQQRAHPPDPTPRLVTHTTHPKRPDKHQHNPQTQTQPQLRQVRSRPTRPEAFSIPPSRFAASGRARVASRQSAPRAHPAHRPAGTALRGGGVSRESRVHPSRTCSTGRDTSIGRGPFANCGVSRSTPEAAVHPASGLTMIRQGVSSPHRLVSSRAKNPIRS